MTHKRKNWTSSKVKLLLHDLLRGWKNKLLKGKNRSKSYIQKSGSTQCGVYTFVGSTKLTSPTWWGFLYLLNSSKDNEWLRMLPIALEEELRLLQFSSVRLLSRVRLFATPWTAAHQTSLSISNSWSLLKLMFIELAIELSHPLSSPSPPAFNLSHNQGLLQWVSSLHQVAKVLKLQLQLQHQSFQRIFRVDLL